MGFNNPRWSWSELEAALSGKPALGRDRRPPGSPSWNAGGDGPAWSRRRQPFDASGIERATGEVPYAELHCHSAFSFLDGASPPEELVAEAARLGLTALALTDHHGFYGVPRFAEAAREVGLATVFGAEITLTPGLDPDARVARDEAATLAQVATGRVPDASAPDPAGAHLLLLADGPDGYARLSKTLSLGHLAGEKGAPQFTLADVADGTGGAVWALTGCRKGTVPRALADEGPAAARRELDRLVAAFGRDRVLVELWDHGMAVDLPRNDALAELAAQAGVATVATNNVHYATPRQHQLASALAAVRARRSLAELQPWWPATGGAHLRSGAEQQRRFGRWPGAVARAAEIGAAAAFDLRLVAPKLPPFPCPDGLTEIQYLRRLVEVGGRDRYGPRTDDTSTLVGRAWATIDRELDIIESLGFPGYFLVVWEITEFCRRNGIYCQGRGSAANSAVCFALRITNADPVSLNLLFERFLSAARDGPPDIDIDIESDRREEVIQHVYEMHGRWHTAQVANAITYQARSAVRDMARALGYATGQQDAWAKRIDGWGSVASTAAEDDHGIPPLVLDLASQVEHAPRHLGIHSGGMVVCDRPIIEVCPVEWARMDRRSVLQWDKDDCNSVGLVKFDLLGLGMLSALRYAVELIREHRGYEVDLGKLPQEDAVYDMICAADTIGVFQIESRAQMATLPRLRPRCFYDLVIEVALIRPGPIQGGSVHPLIRRRHGLEPVTYLHPLMERSLGKTLGIPLFQEQLMQLAIDLAGFTPADADQLRQAMGSKRSVERMERLKSRLYAGMAERGIGTDVADEIYRKMVAFSTYGFPESHSVSFAHIVYSSSWLKLHEPAAFLCGLLNAQPMGFWSPNSLVQDARRHGVVVRSPDVNASLATATLEPCPESTGGVAARLGLASVRGIGSDLAESIVAERTEHGPYVGPHDLARRVPAVTTEQLEALATADAFTGLGLSRREALWAAGSAVRARPDRLPGLTDTAAPRLPGMTPIEETVADLWATGTSPQGHPTRFLRERLTEFGVTSAAGLRTIDADRRVTVAGFVTHRQRPMTANGTTFLNLEDETGLVNIVVSRGCWQRFRRVAREAPALLIRGRVERADDVINVVAEHIAALPMPAAHTHASRDFR